MTITEIAVEIGESHELSLISDGGTAWDNFVVAGTTAKSTLSSSCPHVLVVAVAVRLVVVDAALSRGEVGVGALVVGTRGRQRDCEEQTLPAGGVLHRNLVPAC